ncbi:hypothetical protein E4U57_000527 [Claviceps arundinis]|uniref:Uncharacterized protein n=1 Tax=Claviceps arundinis TaxID=1623583 RepID=A0ABQ7PCS4_9HYPO|nr:hypothetical protein E4U57_000527 [Claviceps arundinis]
MAPTTRITSLENLLACVEDIDDIRAGKFEPWNLIRLRLRPVRGQRPSDNKGLSSVDISSGHVTVKKKTHLPSEYASDPLIFVNSFSNYVPKASTIHDAESLDRQLFHGEPCTTGTFLIHDPEAARAWSASAWVTHTCSSMSSTCWRVKVPGGRNGRGRVGDAGPVLEGDSRSGSRTESKSTEGSGSDSRPPSRGRPVASPLLGRG